MADPDKTDKTDKIDKTADSDDVSTLIRKHALKNAVSYDGKANPGKLVGKIIQDRPDLKSQVRDLMPKIKEVVSEVNSLTLEQQTGELEENFPEMLEKKEVRRREIFDVFDIAEGQEVISAFPPGPEKYPHLGHGKYCVMNLLLARKYGGRFILRFDDTNPKTVKNIFYDIMQKDLRWFGIEWDDVVCASDFMDLYYDAAVKAINSGDAYVCNCDADKIQLSRSEGVPCECRTRSINENLELWEQMFDLPEGHAVLRLKIDLEHKNTTMRDPTIFRILDDEHARTGKKYRVWPNYDWQNSILDGYLGVTHRIRGKEFELRTELQHHIQDLVGYDHTLTYEGARFNLRGVESSGRVIREKIEHGELLGWDDPELTTIAALRRRGFQPEALRSFVLSTGLTKSESTLTWDDLIKHNKRLLDAEADRYFFVVDPVEIAIKGAPDQEVELNLHPEHRKGGRKFSCSELFYISKDDFDSLEVGKLYRLMDCLNFRRTEDGFEYAGNSLADYKKQGESIMHWLPKSENLVDVDVLMPDKEAVSGLAEPLVLKLDENDVIQFERFGFCRVDDKTGDNKVKFWYTHK